MREDSTMRRSAIGLMLALALVVASLATEAQQPKNVHRIGTLSALGTTPGRNPFVEAFLEGMRALGYVEGQHFVLEYRGAEGQFEGFPALAAELVRLKVEVIVAQGTPAALAAKHATTMIPVVMVGVGDPVGSGLVASLARPGGNLTGLSNLSPELVRKQLEFLKDVRPTVSRVAVLWNPANPASHLMVRAADVAAQALGVQLHLVEARGRGPDAFDSAFAAMTSAHAGALLVLADSIFFEHRRRLAELAAMSHLPTMHQDGRMVEAGGLISYVEQPTRFELVINLKTAQALGITMPPSLLLLADEVIR
jgi:putative tryptophan/tyrosine transport system substrate-binding protein